MDWGSVDAAALIGALGGAAGAVVGSLVGRFFPEKSRRIVTVIFVVLFAVAGPRLIQPMLQPPITVATLEAELMRDPSIGPLAAAWKRADLPSFTATLQQVATAMQNGKLQEQAVNEFRATLQAAAGPRFAYFDDAQILSVAAMARDQYVELSRSHPSSCHPLFNGAPFGDITPYLSEEVRQRELDLLRQAFEASPPASTNILPPEQAPAAIDAVLAQVRARTGDDVVLLGPGVDLSGREQRYCEVVAEFFTVVLSMPPAEGAAFIRRLRAMR